MKRTIKPQADYTLLVFIPDPASTDGSGKTGLVAADLTVSYVRVETDNDVTVTDVTSSLNNLSALTDAHNDWGLLKVSDTLAPGLYRLDIADAVIATGAWSAVVYVMITTSAAAASPIEFVIVAYDPNDGVRLGLTGLANAVPGAAGGLMIAGSNAATTLASLTATGGIIGDITGNLSGTVGTVNALANDSVSAAALAADAGAEIADAILDRNMATGADNGSTSVRTMRQALRFLRNKWSISGGTLTVTKEDDSTSSWTSVLTTTGGTDPVTASDPAGP